MTGNISFLPILQFVTTAILIIGLVRFFKWRGKFSDADQPVFDKLVTEIALPVGIFAILATFDFSPETLLPAGILFLALMLTVVLAFLICHICHFRPAVTGTIIMVAGFGSTATMGNSLLLDFFSSQPTLVEKGITVQMLGVGFPIFTIGIFIASYYGAKEAGKIVKVSNTLKEFMETPIFISFIIGITMAFLMEYFQVPGIVVFSDFFFHFFTVISLSLSLFVWFAIGLMLRPIKIRYFLPLFLLVVGIKLFFEPLVVSGLVISAVSPLIVKQILLLEGAMPSGAIAAVIASRYGCDRSLAGWLVVGTYLVSLITIPLLFLGLPW